MTTDPSMTTPTTITYSVPVLTTADIAAAAAREAGVVWWALEGHWFQCQGPKTVEALNGLVTNDVVALPVGQAQHAAALTAKGKVVTDLLLVRHDVTTVLVWVPLAGAEAWQAMIRKYVNPRLSAMTDVSARWHAVMLTGGGVPDTVRTFAEAVGAPSESAAPTWHAIPSPFGFTPPATLVVLDSETPARALQTRLTETGAHTASSALATVYRVETGWPALGVDMDGETLAQEANLDALGAISFNKGCYTGQETVARIHFRGHVNRQLRGLTASVLLEPGATVLGVDDAVIGAVRSAVTSPAYGPIALAMLRRELPVGGTVTVCQGSDRIPATVVALPFGAA
jgi:folate-binding protein YgfZ